MLQIKAMMARADHTVDVIIALHDAVAMHSEVLSRFSQWGKDKLPNHGKTIIVARNALVRAIFDVFKRIYRKAAEDLYLVASCEAAENLLAEDAALLTSV